MPLSKLQFNPGVNRESLHIQMKVVGLILTRFDFKKVIQRKNRWLAKTRRRNILRNVSCAASLGYVKSRPVYWLGHNQKYYIGEGGAYNDITPIRAQTAAGDVTFAATNGSSTRCC